MAFDQNKPQQNAPLASADIRNNFQHIKNAISQEHTWSDANAGAIKHNLDTISVAVTGSTQNDIYPGGSISGTLVGNFTELNQYTGVAGGDYSIRSLLQDLVNRSHTHGLTTVSGNCVCDCNCQCGDNCY